MRFIQLFAEIIFFVFNSWKIYENISNKWHKFSNNDVRY